MIDNGSGEVVGWAKAVVAWVEEAALCIRIARSSFALRGLEV